MNEKLWVLSVVGEAGTGKQGIKLAEMLKPNVVLLDFYLPDMAGFEVSKRIVKINPKSKIIVISGSSDNCLLAKLFDSKNVHGIMTKGSVYSCVDAIKAVWAGRRYIQPDIVNELSIVSQANPYAEFTERQVDVFKLFLQGVSKELIAERYHLTEKTIRNMRSNVANKVGVLKTKPGAVY